MESVTNRILCLQFEACGLKLAASSYLTFLNVLKFGAATFTRKSLHFKPSTMKYRFLLFAFLVIIFSNTTFAQQPGDLDNNFNASGAVITDLASYEIAYAVAVQPDGKIVVVG